MANQQYGAYGGYVPPQQQYGAAQYAYPKKKFPMQYLVIIILIAVLGVLFGGYFLGLFGGGGGGTAAVVSPANLNIQAAAGKTTEGYFTISNPTNREFSTTVDTSALPAWISVDKSFVTLAPGDSTQVKLTFSPLSTTESTTAFIYFSNIDAYVSATVTILPPPDVTITLSKPGLQIYQGSIGNVLLTLNNYGSSPALNTTISFSGIDDDWVSFDETSFDIDPNEEKTIPVSFNIPALAKEGGYESIVTVKGIGFTESTLLSLTVSKAIGTLHVAPEEISGTKTSGEVVKLTLTNSGNADLFNVNLTSTGAFRNIATFSETTIPKLGAGQSTEVGVTLSGTNRTYTGSIEVKALDTHSTTQSQIVTVSVTII